MCYFVKLGRALEAYRVVEKLTLRELAKQIGVDHTALWRFERGKEVTNACWVKIFLWLVSTTNNTKGH